MKYTYFYKTPDGVRHEAAMSAASREDVFVELRKQGIKAIKVISADGSKANGEIRGVRKRVAAAIAALVAAGVGVFAFIWGSHSVEMVSSKPPVSAPRHQIYGDPAVMESFEHGNFSGVLNRPGDVLLAWFAQPGRCMCPPDTNLSTCTDSMASNLLAIISSDLPILSSESREICELKQIVNGMRQEFLEYLQNGNGTAFSYWRRLTERLEEEKLIYERAERELMVNPSPELRAERNAALRNLGLRSIPLPKTE